MGFFDEFKDKFKRAGEITDDEEYFDDYDDEEEYEYQDDTASQESGAYAKSSSYDPSTDYDFGYDISSSSSNSSSRAGSYASHSSPKTSASNSSRTQTSNIYRMDNAASRESKVSRVIFFVLEDAEDAINIADCMIEKNAVVLADFSKLNREDAMKVLNFLDGVRYICKSSIEAIGNIHLIVPDSIELTGDFFDQMSKGIFIK